MASTDLQVVERSNTAIARPTLAPTNLAEAMKFAEVFSKSELIPKEYQNKPGNIVVAIQYGMEIGLQPLQAMQSVAVINGRPSLWGDAVLAVVMSHPDYVSHEERIEGEGDAMAGVFIVERRGHKPHEQRFSIADAKKAGLWGRSGPWTQYSSRMLKMRARGFALRDKFPDALKGIISREEAEDYTTVDGGSFAKVSQPAPEPAPPTATTISADQAREFGRAYKQSGYSSVEAKDWCTAALDVTSTLKIPTSRFDEAMTWANTPKPQAEPSEDEQECRAMFEVLGVADDLQRNAIHDAGGDWAALRAKLRVALDEEAGNA